MGGARTVCVCVSVCGTDAAATALSHRLCVCGGVLRDACVYVLIWPGVI